MKTVIVANPRAGAHGVGKRWKEYNRSISAFFGPAEVRLTEGPNDATRLTREAVLAGFERVVVVGGDGTLNECVNGFFSEHGDIFLGENVSLVLYPAGTGGDFCRSIGMASGSIQDIMQDATERRIDLGRVTFLDPYKVSRSRYFVNISSFGASGLVVDRVNHSSKVLGGRLSFLLGTVQGLVTYRHQRVRLQIDDTFDEEVSVNTVAVANARYFGGSMKMAPNALVDDGLLDIVIVEDLGLKDFLRYGMYLYQGRHGDLPNIRMLQGRQVKATPLDKTPVLMELDGEQPGALPLSYTLLPRILRVYAPWDRAQACVCAPAGSEI